MPKMPIQDPRKASAALAALPTAEAGRASPSAAASSAIVTLYVVLEDAYERERKASESGVRLKEASGPLVAVRLRDPLVHLSDAELWERMP